MYSLLVTYKFKNKADRDGFYENICDDRIAKATMKQDGCIRYEYELPESDTELLLHEEWEDKAKQQAHLKEPTVNFVKGYKMRFGAETEVVELGHREDH